MNLPQAYNIVEFFLVHRTCVSFATIEIANGRDDEPQGHYLFISRGTNDGVHRLLQPREGSQMH